ncbi:MAG: glycosyltransferase, partial [Firmicutes bacterium]|nr:glycosyltransferase [Bacillota bacterium]
LIYSNIGKIYVADDASEDETAKVAESFGVTVLKASKNLGKGGVLNFALPQIESSVICLLDADLGASSVEGKKLIEEVLLGADLAIAQFRSKGGFGLVRKATTFLLFLKTGRLFKSPLSGQRAARKEVWESLLPFAPGFSIEVAMLKKACQGNLKIVEVPVEMTDRSYGKGLKGMTHRFKQLLAVIRGLR